MDVQEIEIAKERSEWTVRIARAVLDRQFDDETLLAMLFAGFDKAHSQGLEDAAYVCEQSAANVTEPIRKHVATVLGTAIRNLDKLNKSTAQQF